MTNPARESESDAEARAREQYLADELETLVNENEYDLNPVDKRLLREAAAALRIQCVEVDSSSSFTQLSTGDAPVPVSVENELLIAERIARKAHQGQREESTGDDYILHVARVVALVDGDKAKAVAWLHDVLEDSSMTAHDLTRAGISDEVVDAVTLLTRRVGDTYREYIDTIRTFNNRLASHVKVADLLDHLRPNCPARLRPRYERALQAFGVDGVAVGDAPEESKPAKPKDDPSRSPAAGVEAGGPLRALIAKWRRIAAQHREQDSLVGAYAHESCADELDALLSAPVASGWQPISTAPKDSTEILLRSASYKRVGNWARRRECWSIDALPPVAAPTHWAPIPQDLEMPLPAAPVASFQAPAASVPASTTEIPRRARLDLFTPAERAIYDAVQAVEAVGADVRLTDAVILLQAARDSVADYVDGVEKRRYVREQP
jgi:hypothetical protein